MLINIIFAKEAKRPNKNHQLFSLFGIPSHRKLFYKSQAGHGEVGPVGNFLLPNSSETAWNFQTAFYRKDYGTQGLICDNLLFSTGVPHECCCSLWEEVESEYPSLQKKWSLKSLQRPPPANYAETLISPKYQPCQRASFLEGPQTSIVPNQPDPKGQQVKILFNSKHYTQGVQSEILSWLQDLKFSLKS